MAKKYYSALLTQSSTNAPTAESVKSTIGIPVYAHSSTGVFTMTLTGAFTENKTKIRPGSVAGAIISAVRTSDDVITITTQTIDGDGEAVANGVLADTLFEVEIDE